MPPGTPPGAYDLELRVYERESEALLAVAAGPEASVEKRVLILAEVMVARGAKPVAVRELALANHVNATYAGRLRLLGYNVSRRKARPGEELKLDLHWLALREMESDYRLDLWLSNRRGELAAELVGWPSRAEYPTSLWSPGEIVRGQPGFELPPDLEPGSYQLRLVVRDPRSGWALPFWRPGLPWAQAGLNLGSLQVRGAK